MNTACAHLLPAKSCTAWIHTAAAGAGPSLIPAHHNSPCVNTNPTAGCFMLFAQAQQEQGQAGGCCAATENQL